MTGQPLDPARVRANLAEIELEQRAQQHVVEYLADLLDSAERALASIDRRLDDLRTHPAVVAALRPHQRVNGYACWCGAEHWREP